MFARTSTWSGSPAALEAWAGHVTGQVAPMVKGLPGNAGAVFLIDRDAGTALTLTLWDSEEAALASDQTAERSREATVAAAGVELTGRGRYEVIARS
jgi:heme-degrading monooxygenase HmoA